MIVNIEKCLVIGVKEHLDQFFRKAQQQGLFEFLPYMSKRSQNLPKLAQDLLTCIKILKKEGQGIDVPFGKEYTVQELVTRIIFLKNTLEKHHEEQRIIKQEIVAISHFGEFSFEEIQEIQSESQRVMQFFFRGHNKKNLPLPSAELIHISSDLHADYYLGIHKEPRFFPDFVEMHFDREPEELKKRLEQIEYDLKNYHQELKQLTGYNEFIRENFLLELNRHHLDSTKEEVEPHFEGQLFSVEAWIAKEDLSKAYQLIGDLGVHIEKIAKEKEDRIPTCMRNKGLKKVGEDLVEIYDIPSHTDKDPSGFVITAFAVFFAMIVADAGYGIVYFLLSLVAWFKLSKKSDIAKRMIKLFFLISSCCVIWGVLIGSYFGIALHPENPLQRASILQELILQKAAYHMQLKDKVYQHFIDKLPQGTLIETPLDFVLSIKKQNGSAVTYEILEEFNNSILMEIAILVGVIHIIISLSRYILRNLSSIGWICFIIGGYLFFPSMMNGATSIFNFIGWIPKKGGAEVGMQLVFIGIGVAWILALIQHKLKGLEEPLKSIQIFADILSYLRLYALSLAGIIMAGTFNQMGMEVGYAPGFFIIVAGHLLNMTIGIMGGFIHGLRLNFLEWYHYSFEGGGKLFNPLRILK